MVFDSVEIVNVLRGGGDQGGIFMLWTMLSNVLVTPKQIIYDNENKKQLITIANI